MTAEPRTTTCPVCGTPGRIVGTNEGTQHFEALDPLREAAQAVVTLTDDLARWDELNGYVINSERDWLAANLSAAWEQLRAALREGGAK